VKCHEQAQSISTLQTGDGKQAYLQGNPPNYMLKKNCTLLGFFLPVALLFACSLLVVACDFLIAPGYGRSLVTFFILVLKKNVIGRSICLKASARKRV
jgi:hypothetical protein